MSNEDKTIENAGQSTARSAEVSFNARKRNAFQRQLASLKDDLDSGELGDLDEIEISIKLETLERSYAHFEAAQAVLEEEDYDELEGEARTNASKVYTTIKVALMKAINARQVLQAPLSSTVRQFDSRSAVVMSQPKARLPALKIPSFGGKCTEWPDFFSMFQTIVGEDAELSKIEKFQHLRSCLTDAALDTIRSLEICDINYDKAIELLKKRFDNKRLNFQAHIREIVELGNVETGSVIKLRNLSDQLNAHMRALLTLGSKEQVGDFLLIHIVSQKLDVASRTKWEETVATSDALSWNSMASFLEQRCLTQETVQNAMVTTPSTQVSKRPNFHFNNKRNVYVASTKPAQNCAMCHSFDHVIEKCKGFIDLIPALRFQEVKKLSLCINCLRKGHTMKVCKSGSCRHCSSKHHSLLHMYNSPPPGLLPIVESSTSTNDICNLTQQSALVAASSLEPQREEPMSRAEEFVFLATAVVFVKNRVGSLIPCRVILDSASQLHFVTSRFASQLQIPPSKSATLISGIGQADFVADQVLEICLQARIGHYATWLSAVVVHTIVENQPSYSTNNINWNIPANIQLADPLFFKSQRVDLLIGASLFFDLMCVGQIRLGPDLPLLQKTRLGWIVSGSSKISAEKRSCLMVAGISSSQTDEDYSLNELVKGFWEVENVSESNCMISKEDLDCEQHFSETHTRLSSGAYAVRLPMKGSPSKLGDSYHQALHRFRKLEERLQRNPDLKLQYSNFLKEYVDLNHMSLVDDSSSKIFKYFLPHHCVFKADSTTTKLRVVFDGSARASSGFSLNDMLMAGPTIQPSLFTILLRFRSFKIALTGDVCKMYRCVRVLNPDNYLQCILWREKPEDPIQCFTLDTVTYGTKAASFLAIRAMQQLAIDEGAALSVGAKIICRDFYVDDLITGGSSESEVLRILSQTTMLLAKGDFKLRKWCSNEANILKRIAESDKEQLLKFQDGSGITKTLGLIWNPTTDTFLFNFVPFSAGRRATKRSVLSFIARFYDPLGLIGPAITQAKIFLQRLWKERVEWDESLSQSMQSSWSDLCAGFQLLNRCIFPRLVLTPSAKFEVHAFCDASLAAYGACIYIRSELNGGVRINLLCSKSRVAPLKSSNFPKVELSVPKLELSAALLLAELTESISRMGIFEGKFYCWSDSTIVLSWLREDASKFNVFVSNRISRIQALTANMTWHHVPTEDNPADILSRGATPQQLEISSLWKFGPPYLLREQSSWPPSPATHQELPERRKTALILTTKIKDFSIDCKFVNSFGKMQRIYAYIYRFGSSRGAERVKGPLTTNEIKQGTWLLLRMVQKVHLTSDYKVLEERGSIDKSSKLFSIRPYLDSNGLLRVTGRLQNSDLDFESKHPIIMPKGHPLAESLINYFHQKLMHAGPQSLLASIRLQYWPLGGVKEVSRIIRKCIGCFRLKPKIMDHIMGNLPRERVQQGRTFLTTGVDFCGPFFYKSEIRNRPPVKCYISLFICFSTKAVHLELARDLSTASFLAALKRFSCIRGRPHTIWSDNATNFVGAKNELADLRQLFLNDNHQQAVHQQCLEDGINWRFIPPRSPHFGGLWEASIKIAKLHLRRTIGLSILNFEELQTIICQISAIINSRPLCPISENADNLDVLTPAHFLIGGPLTAIPEPDVSVLNINRLGRWQRVCHMQQIFWKKWSSEYLTLLQQRSKWRHSTTRNLAVGDMVLLKDENLPPLKWPLGRVIEVVKGEDEIVRVAIIRTSNGTTKRAVSKLCMLPIERDDVESVQPSTGGGCLEDEH